MKAANNDVRDGISDVSTALHRQMIAIDKTCRHTIEEFASYCWDEKKAQHGEEAPVKTNDHCMDALRYFIYTMKIIKKFRDSEEYNATRYISAW